MSACLHPSTCHCAARGVLRVEWPLTSALLTAARRSQLQEAGMRVPDRVGSNAHGGPGAQRLEWGFVTQLSGFDGKFCPGLTEKLLQNFNRHNWQWSICWEDGVSWHVSAL